MENGQDNKSSIVNTIGTTKAVNTMTTQKIFKNTVSSFNL